MTPAGNAFSIAALCNAENSREEFKSEEVVIRLDLPPAARAGGERTVDRKKGPGKADAAAGLRGRLACRAIAR